jgi:hypothetical protein
MATILGAFVVGGLMGGIGLTHVGDASLGAPAGAALGGVLGRGVVTGTTSPVTVFAVLFGLAFCMIGPGYDDYGGAGGIVGAGLGAFMGWLCFGSRRQDVSRGDPADTPGGETPSSGAGRREPR